MADLLGKKRPKGRGRGRAKRKAVNSPIPGLVGEDSAASYSSYEESSDVDSNRASSVAGSVAGDGDGAGKLTLKPPCEEDQFLDAELEKISFNSMEMTSSPLVNRTSESTATAANGPVMSLSAQQVDAEPDRCSPASSEDVNDGGGGEAAEGRESPQQEDGETIFIKVTQIVDPCNFSAQVGRVENFDYFSELETAINTYCQQTDVERTDEYDFQYYVLARHNVTERWRRAMVMRKDSECDEVDVYYIDYGTTELLQLSDVIYPVPQEFFPIPQFAYLCTVDGVKPLASVWISRAVSFFKDLVFEKELEVKVRGGEIPLKVTIFVSLDGVKKSVADLLLDQEVAMPCISPTLCLQLPQEDTSQRSSPEIVITDTETGFEKVEQDACHLKKKKRGASEERASPEVGASPEHQKEESVRRSMPSVQKKKVSREKIPGPDAAEGSQEVGEEIQDEVPPVAEGSKAKSHVRKKSERYREHPSSPGSENLEADFGEVEFGKKRSTPSSIEPEIADDIGQKPRKEKRQSTPSSIEPEMSDDIGLKHRKEKNDKEERTPKTKAKESAKLKQVGKNSEDTKPGSENRTAVVEEAQVDEKEATPSLTEPEKVAEDVDQKPRKEKSDKEERKTKKKANESAKPKPVEKDSAQVDEKQATPSLTEHEKASEDIERKPGKERSDKEERKTKKKANESAKPKPVEKDSAQVDEKRATPSLTDPEKVAEDIDRKPRKERSDKEERKTKKKVKPVEKDSVDLKPVSRKEETKELSKSMTNATLDGNSQTPETKPHLGRAKSEPRNVVQAPKATFAVKAPPAFQFDQLFKESAKIPKRKVPDSPETPEAEPLWKTDPDIALMFGKEVVESKILSELGLIPETDDEGHHVIEERLKQLRNGRLRREPSPIRKSQSPSRSSPRLSGRKPEKGGDWKSPKLNTSREKKLGLKGNLDEVLKAFDGKMQQTTAPSADTKEQVFDEKSGLQDKRSAQEKRDDKIVAFLETLNTVALTSDVRVREQLIGDLCSFVDNEKVDLTSVLSPVDLETYMRSLLRMGVVSSEKSNKSLLPILELLQRHDSFGSTSCFVMSDIMLEFVKITTKGKRKSDRSEEFCRFLIQLIQASRQWTVGAKHGILDFTQKTLEKWLIFNKKKLMAFSAADLEKLFLKCCIRILRETGRILNEFNPEKMTWIMSELRERQLDHDMWSRKTREDILDLLLLHARGWGCTPRTVARQDSWSQYDHPSIYSVEIQCNLLEPSSAATQTDKVEASGKEFKSSAERDREIAAKLQEEPAEYAEVKAMLYELHLDQRYPDFVSWGITDALLNSDEINLGDYMVTCGFSIPIVSKMMRYLNRDVPAPYVPEKKVPEPQQDLEDLVRNMGLPSARLFSKQLRAEEDPEVARPAKKYRSTPPPTEDKKLLDTSFDSADSLKEIAKSLFKTDKEIKKDRLQGASKPDWVAHPFTVIPTSKDSYSKALDKKENIEIDNSKEFPPLSDAVEEVIEEELPEKALRFSEILRKKAERDFMKEYMSRQEKSMPVHSTVEDWFEVRLQEDESGSGRQSKNSEREGETGKRRSSDAKKSKRVSDGVAQDWFVVDYEDAVLSGSQKENVTGTPADHGARNRSGDSWKLKRYSQSSPISRDTCNNVITHKDTLGLNAISKMLESGHDDPPAELDQAAGSSRAEPRETQKTNGWWHVPSPAQDCEESAQKETKKPNVKTDVESDSRIQSSGKPEVQKIGLDKKPRNTPITRGLQPESGNGSMGLNVVTDLKSGTSTPDCWSDLSGSECEDPPATFVPAVPASEMCHEPRPQINRNAVKTMLCDWISEEKEVARKDESKAKPKGKTVTSKSSDTKPSKVKHIVQESKTVSTASHKSNDSGPNEGNIEGNWRQKECEKKSNVLAYSREDLLKYDPNHKPESKQKPELNQVTNVVTETKPLEYNYAYLPNLDEMKPVSPDNILDRKFAFDSGDDLSDSDDEVAVILDGYRDGREEEQDKRRIRYEKYVRQPESTFKGLSKMKVRCCNCGDESHRTYACPKPML